MTEAFTHRNHLPTRTIAVALACAAAVALAGTLVFAPALALGSASGVVRECEQTGSLGKHSLQDLQDALKKLPSDVDQYSDCRSIINRAINAIASGSKARAAGGAGTGVIATAKDEAAIQKALRKGGARLRIGGEQVVPGGAGELPPGQAVPIFGSSFVHALPTPIWLVLAATLMGALALLTPPAWKRLKWIRDRVGR